MRLGRPNGGQVFPMKCATCNMEMANDNEMKMHQMMMPTTMDMKMMKNMMMHMGMMMEKMMMAKK